MEFPNVFRFLCVDDPGDIVEENMGIDDLLGDDYIKEKLVEELSIPKESVERAVADTVIYTHGLATMLLWDNFKLDKGTAYQMIYDQARMCFAKYGIELKPFKE